MKSFQQFSEDNNEIQVGDRFVPLRSRKPKPSLKLDPKAMGEPREAPVRSYVDPDVVDTAPKLDLGRDMQLKLDKDAEKDKMSDEQRISRLLDRNSDVYSQLRDNKLLQDRILGNADFAENFFGSEMFRDHFMDLERFNSERPERTTRMAMKPGQDGAQYPQRYQQDYGAGRLTGTRKAAQTAEQPNWFEMHELDDEDKFYDYAKAVSRIMDRSYGDFMGGEDQSTGNKKSSRYVQGIGFRKGSEQGPKNELPMEEAIREWLGKFTGAEISDLSDGVDFSNPRHFSIADNARREGVRFEDLFALGRLLKNGSLDDEMEDNDFKQRVEALAAYSRQVRDRREESDGSDSRTLEQFLKDPFFEAEDQKAGAREAGFDDDEIAQFLQDERIQHFPAGRILFGDRFGLDNNDYDWEEDESLAGAEETMEELSSGMPLLPAIADMAFGEDSTSENRELAMQLLAYQLGNTYDDDPTDGIWGNDPDAAAYGGYGMIDSDLDVDDLMKIAEMDPGAGFEETTTNFIDNINRLRNLGYEEGTFYDEDNDNYNETELVSTTDMADALQNSNSFEDAYDRVRSIINDNYDEVRERMRDEGEDYSEDGHRLEDLYPDGKVPDIEDVDKSERKEYKDNYTNFGLTIYNNPNEFGTHRYETLDDDLENAGLTRKDLKKSVYIAWQAMTGKDEKASMAARYKAKTGKGEDDPGFEPFARKVIAFNALKNWKQNVLPTLKPGTIVFNTPISGGAGGNMREVLYSKMGFGEYGVYGQQGVVGKDGRVYPIGPKTDTSLAGNLRRRADARRGRRPQNESMGEVMYWWQQNPWLSQDEILLVLDAI